jgi:hypothetical protein
MSSFLSDRLAEKLARDGYSQDAVSRLRAADFSGGRAGTAGWDRHNERVHVAILICSEERGFDAALELARTDWRDVLVAGGLADDGWTAWLDGWFGESR